MDWLVEMEDERRLLKRVVAFLFLFAWLARMSCALPQSARSYVLSVLGRAETRVREFVVDMAEDHGVPVPLACIAIPTLPGLDTVAAARQLAQSFRALAVLLDRVADGYSGRRTFASQYNAGNSLAAGLLAVLCRALVDAADRQVRLHKKHLAVGYIDSS